MGMNGEVSSMEGIDLRSRRSCSLSRAIARGTLPSLYY